MKKVFLKCSGCGYEPSLDDKQVITGCKKRDIGDTDHILQTVITEQNAFPQSGLPILKDGEDNPYIVFKELFLSYHLAKKYGVDYEGIVYRIQEALQTLDEPGFFVTPLLTEHSFEYLQGKLFIKNETGNVTGSHKARHLMGNILYYEVMLEAGIIIERPKLAVYSCGNAGIAAAGLARAAGYDIDVFIPEDVDPKVIDYLTRFKANVVCCPRVENEAGDPCYNCFQEALSNGSISFSCSGPDNWSNIEGGQTLGLELAAQLTGRQLGVDSIVVQVGGGALASSTVKAFEELNVFGLLKAIPKIFLVQTTGSYPLLRAYHLLARDISKEMGIRSSFEFVKLDNKEVAIDENQKILHYSRDFRDEIMELAVYIKEHYDTDSRIKDLLFQAAQNKMSSYMWCWEEEPHSKAHGILDDITYDWFNLVQGMFRSGGIPVAVSEDEIEKSNVIGRELTGLNVDYTGSSGFAGLMNLISSETIATSDNVAVIFTGADR